MIRHVFAAAILAALSSAVVAQGDPIAERKQMMKSIGGATGDAAKMLKGEAPFDLAKVQVALKSYSDVSKKFGALFPANSKEGGETTAAPKIWEDMAGFKAGLDKMDKEAAAAAAAIKDEASFKATMPNVLKNCGGCHETYRIKKG